MDTFDAFIRRRDYFKKVAAENQLKTKWLLLDVKDITQTSPFAQQILRYNGNEVVIKKEANFATWLELWKSAEEVVFTTNKKYYVGYLSISEFVVSNSEPNVVYLSTEQ